MECLVSGSQRRCHERPRQGSASFAGGGSITWKTPWWWRNSQHADAQCRPGKDRMPGPVDQCDRPHHDQREWLVPADDLLSLQLGAAIRARFGAQLSGRVSDLRSFGKGQVPYLDVAGTLSPEDGKVSLFVLNRDLSKAHAIEVNWQDKAPSKTLSSMLLTGDDLKAFNSFDTPQKVAPRSLDKPSIAGGRAKFEVPARSYAVIQWGS